MADGLFNDINANTGDSWDYLQQVLAHWGLTGADAQTLIDNAFTQQWSPDRIVQGLRTTDSYKQRYGVILKRQELGLPPMSESDVLNTEKAFAQINQQAGLPATFSDQPQDFAALIINDVSPQEYQDRVINGYQAAMQAPQEVRDMIHNYYGTPLTQGEMAAFFLDPNKTDAVLQKQLTAAQIGAQGVGTGYGNINATQAENLASQGVTQAQAQQGFSQLGNESQLFQGLPGQNEQNITQDQQLAAQFSGNVQDQQAIANRAKQRIATFQQGGSFSPTQTGTSVGTAQ